MSDEGMNRRDFLRTAGIGAGAVAAGTGAAAAQEGGGQQPIDYGGWMADANGFSEGGTVDARGQSEVNVIVGGSAAAGLSFEPAAVQVDPGTTILFEWSGEGGAHNVEEETGPFSFEASEIVADEGFEFELQIPDDASGILQYFCNPHKGQGMLGAIAIGDDVPRVSNVTPPPIVDESARTLGVATLIAMVSTLGLAYFFMKYGGDYDQ